MKYIFFTALLLFSLVFYAQPPRGNGGKYQQNENRPPKGERKVRKASDLAGILYYDVKEVLKKIKVKDDAVKVNVINAMQEYNTKNKEISSLNSVMFKDIDALLKSTRSHRNQATSKDDLRRKIGEIIRPIRKDVRMNDNNLNRRLERTLSEKELKRWLKYQKTKKNPSKPDRSKRNYNGQQPQNQNKQKRF